MIFEISFKINLNLHYIYTAVYCSSTEFVVVPEPHRTRTEPYHTRTEPYCTRTEHYRTRIEPYRNLPYMFRTVPYPHRAVQYFILLYRTKPYCTVLNRTKLY